MRYNRRNTSRMKRISAVRTRRPYHRMYESAEEIAFQRIESAWSGIYKVLQKYNLQDSLYAAGTGEDVYEDGGYCYWTLELQPFSERNLAYSGPFSRDTTLEEFEEDFDAFSRDIERATSNSDCPCTVEPDETFWGKIRRMKKKNPDATLGDFVHFDNKTPWGYIEGSFEL